MGCCSVTQRHAGMTEVGPDEIELLEISSAGVWGRSESQFQRSDSQEVPLPSPSLSEFKQDADYSVTSVPKECPSSQAILWGRSRQELHQWVYSKPICSWEGQPASAYGEIVWSSIVFLHNHYTQMTKRYLVLFSFHLLILAMDDREQAFIYEGVLPLSGTSVQAVPQDSKMANAFEIIGPMVEARIFICASSTDRSVWLGSIEERRKRALRLQLSPSHSALSYLVPCDKTWKKEELKRYLLQAPIWQWEGRPIQHLGPMGYLSLVHVVDAQRQEPQERLLLLFPEDLLLLSLDSRHIQVKYEGRLPRTTIKALEKSALPGRLQFELTGDFMMPLLVSCHSAEDYQTLIFQLQQPEQSSVLDQSPPPLIPKKRRS
ncbi:probable pleckstrin homology domain-containing family N member 1 isoform X2 [Paramormyrops kingsleyae]|uniref:probable pleckstrin homology domain-containing family N member 1 isoform X2 n=1 Tax=Paramormyrops kingsleyae TaxID=1676925 RepID=UPI003B96D2CA